MQIDRYKYSHAVQERQPQCFADAFKSMNCDRWRPCALQEEAVQAAGANPPHTPSTCTLQKTPPPLTITALPRCPDWATARDPADQRESTREKTVFYSLAPWQHRKVPLSEQLSRFRHVRFRDLRSRCRTPAPPRPASCGCWTPTAGCTMGVAPAEARGDSEAARREGWRAAGGRGTGVAQRGRWE